MIRFLIQYLFRYLFVHQVFHLLFYVGFQDKWVDVSWVEWLNALRFDYWILGLGFGVGSVLLLVSSFFPGGKKGGLILFHGLQIFPIVLTAIDFGLYPFANKRLQRELFLTKGMTEDIGALFGSFFVDYWWLLLLTLGLLALVFYKGPKWEKPSWSVRLAGYWVLWLGFCFLGIRGGWQLKPLGMKHAGQWVRNENTDLVLNSGFTFIKTWNNPFWFNEKWSRHSENLTPSPDQGVEVKKNVLVLIVESLGTENLTDTITPFLSALAKQGGLVATSFGNGTRSIEAVPSILCGIPHLYQTPLINSSHATDPFRLLGKNWKDHVSLFFHGGRNGTMGFQEFLNGVGLDRYLGLDEFVGDREMAMGKWGIHDAPFLDYTGRYLDTLSGPFVASVFTLSSHHPFTVPSEMPSALGIDGNELQKTLRYADWSIQQFFEKWGDKQWFKNTVFVITGDHTSLSEDPAFQTPVGKFRVPIMVYMPGEQTRVTALGQHIDIPYTIERLLGDSTRSKVLANDLLDTVPVAIWNLKGTEVWSWNSTNNYGGEKQDLNNPELSEFVARMNGRSW